MCVTIPGTSEDHCWILLLTIVLTVVVMAISAEAGIDSRHDGEARRVGGSCVPGRAGRHRYPQDGETTTADSERSKDMGKGKSSGQPSEKVTPSSSSSKRHA